MSHGINAAVLACVLGAAAAPAAADKPALPAPAQDRFYQDVAWSPDGEWIAYSEYAGGEYATEKWSIHIARRNGSESRLLTPNATWVTWSPDGRQLAFQSERDGDPEIYVADRDGSNVIRITDNPASDSAPAWSPDGARIAFSSDRGGNTDIYVMSAGGADVRRLTEDPARDFSPSWSPGSDHFVFYRDAGDRRSQVWVREVDGAREWNVTADDANNIFPCFLADGSLAFSSKKGDGDARIVVLDADGKNRRTLGPPGAFFARWSPDGGTVAFIAGRWPRAAIYVMRADGESTQKIVN